MKAIVNVEAELSVLGSVLLEGSLFHTLEIGEEHFYERRHKQIFGAMKKAADCGEFIDMVTVTTNLGEAIQHVGGTTYLLKMAESVASTASLKHHESLIFEAYRNRAARESALEFTKNPSEEGLEALIASLQNVREVGVINQEKTTYEHLLDITDEICFTTDEASVFYTSFNDLDDMISGLQKGEVMIVVSRHYVGKTAFALNLAAGHGRNGGSSMIFSLEMGKKQLLQRMISQEGLMNSQKWRNMVFSEKDYAHAFQAIGMISKWKLAIYDNLLTVSAIRSAIRKMIYDHPDEKHVVIIDYLQLIIPTSKQERRDLEIGEMTRELKLLAVELNIPIVLLSQLSRSVESRQNKRPFLSDLRESGNIEQDADVIAFLYRDDYYNHKAGEHYPMEIIISKQRNGPTGTVELAFQKEYGRFVDPSRCGGVVEVSGGRR